MSENIFGDIGILLILLAIVLFIIGGLRGFGVAYLEIFGVKIYGWKATAITCSLIFFLGGIIIKTLQMVSL